MSTRMSPYEIAFKWIAEHPKTGGAARLAKLILSLRNAEGSYSFRECISNLDDELTALSVRVVGHFAEHGEDAHLVRARYRAYETYPRLWDATQVMQRARAELKREWDLADHAADQGPIRARSARR